MVAGSRGFSDYGLMKRKIEEFLEREAPGRPVRILSGRARGADRLGERYAREAGCALKVFPADWETHGRSAGPIRNRKMILSADGAIVFWDGRLRGTGDCLKRAEEKGIPLRVVLFSGPGEQVLNRRPL